MPFDVPVLQGNLVLWSAIGGDSIPMALYHLGELLVRLQALPLETGLLVLEEPPRPAFPLVAPELAEGLLEQVGRVEPLVGGQQDLQGIPAFKGQVLPAGEQDILLALDGAPLLALKTGVFGLAHLVQRIVEVAHRVEFVEQDGCLRRPVGGRIAEWLPHVHHGQPDAAGLLHPPPVIALLHAVLRAILNAVGMSLSDRDFVDADRLGCCSAGPFQLSRQVLLVQLLDGMPVQVQFLGDVLNGTRPATPADEPGKPLGIERVVGKEVETLALHLAAASASNPPTCAIAVQHQAQGAQVQLGDLRELVAVLAHGEQQ
jgi:hypothetical protein